jgi:hypothetical protein
MPLKVTLNNCRYPAEISGPYPGVHRLRLARIPLGSVEEHEEIDGTNTHLFLSTFLYFPPRIMFEGLD